MNERIKTLWDEAGKTHSGESWEELTAFMNCFAELIVRECAEIANKQFTAESGLDDRDCWTAVEIKKHFGVEA